MNPSGKHGMNGLEDWLLKKGQANTESVNDRVKTAKPRFSAVAEAGTRKSARRKGKGRV